MKKAILIAILLVAVGGWPVHAATTSKGDYPLQGGSTHTTAIREHVHEYTDTNTQRSSDYEKFDYGNHVNLEYGLKKWLTLDSHNSYLHKTKEFRSTVGVTFKFGKK